MTTYYVRKTGSDGAAGTSAGAAWATIGKALGASGISSGDTVYIGAGIYRETVTVAMTSAVAETFVLADVDGSKTGDAGEIRWTAYTTNDKTTPSTAATLHFDGRDNLTFQYITFVGGLGDITPIPATIDAYTTVDSTSIKFKDCTFIPGTSNALTSNAQIYIRNSSGTTMNWTFDRCRFLRLSSDTISIIGVNHATTDYNIGVTIQNCLFLGGESGSCIFFNADIIGGSGLPGNLRIYNCTAIGGGFFFRTQGTSSGPHPSYVIGCALVGCNLQANFGGEIIENYNVIMNANPRNSVAAGANSISDDSYSMLMHIGQELAQGKYGRPVGTPTSDSPLLAFGGLSTPSIDIMNSPRPSGPGLSWSNVSTACGCLEFGNCGLKETTTVKSASSSLRLAGPGWHDFDFPVDAVQTTVSVYGRFDGTYAGTKPQMKVYNGTECGVADASTTMTGAANQWEQLSLTFTPTSKGIVTIRLVSNSTAATGKAYFDDFSVA